MSVSVTTIVRDASRLGGGMFSVARPLHSGLLAHSIGGFFVSGNKVADNAISGHIVGMDGRGFKHLPVAMMRSVVHVHGLWTPFEYRAVREARRRGATIVISPHGALEPWAFNHKRSKKRLAWWLYQKRILQSADLIVVNSRQEMRRLRELGLKPPIATIDNGVDLEGFSTEAGKRERIVLFFSRIDPKKGLLDLIDAWQSLGERNGHRLHIYGHGDAAYVGQIAQRIGSFGSDDVAMLPPVFGPARWNVFAQASIYVLPSYSENFGITVGEAMMAGLPVITTRATPWGDLASEGLGWIVDNDVEQLREALHAAIRLDPNTLSDMRSRAMTYAAERFRWEVITQRYAETYSWIAEPSRVEPPAWIDQG